MDFCDENEGIVPLEAAIVRAKRLKTVQRIILHIVFIHVTI